MLGVLACAEPDAREAWLRNTLVLDNQDLYERDADLTGGKLAKMSESPFAFLRGTAPQFARDVLEPGGPVQWRSVVDEHTDDVALVGDAHPENVGTFRSGAGTVHVDFNDFDASTFGPFDLDVVRLAVAMRVACRQGASELPENERALLDDADIDEITRAVPRGWIEEIRTLEQGGNATVPTAANPGGTIAAELIDDSIEDGGAASTLSDATRIVDGQRVMFYGDVEPARILTFGEYEQVVLEHSLRELSDWEYARVEALVEIWAPTLLVELSEPPVVLGVSRRYGQGIASYPLYRWYVLLAGPTDSLDDDLLVEMKEVRDAIPLPGLARPLDTPFDGNGQRVTSLERDLHAFPDADPWLGWADDGGQSFRVRERTGYQDGFEVARIAPRLVARDWTAGDLVEFAALAGHLLGRSHAGATKADGERGLSALARAIDDDDAFVDDVVAFAEAYAPILEDDHRRLIALMTAHGPTLGYDR